MNVYYTCPMCDLSMSKACLDGIAALHTSGLFLGSKLHLDKLCCVVQKLSASCGSKEEVSVLCTTTRQFWVLGSTTPYN